MEKKRIGLVGVGHLGKIHLKCIKEVEGLELVGFHDTNVERVPSISEEFGIEFYSDYPDLLAACDIVDIVTPTVSHYELAIQALKAGKHVFLEKPATHTLVECKDLLAYQHLNQHLKIQVGHVERFNPAFKAIENQKIQPLFIETHRLAPFNPRGLDVSVVMDLMIHDIDLVLHLIPSAIKHISANGVGVVGNRPDIANARIEFENGCVVNLTASRISLKQMRKMRIFQPDAYISMDFLEKQTQIIRLHEKEPEQYLSKLNTAEGERYIQADFPEIITNNAIKEELSTFLESINYNTVPKVTLEDGFAAMEVAHQIIEKINQGITAYKNSRA